MPDKYNRICRLCLFHGNSAKFQRLFKDENDSSSTTEEIYRALQIKISPEKKLSNLVCEECSLKLDFILAFRKWYSRVQAQYAEIKSLWDLYCEYDEEAAEMLLLSTSAEKSAAGVYSSKWLIELFNSSMEPFYSGPLISRVARLLGDEYLGNVTNSTALFSENGFNPGENVQRISAETPDGLQILESCPVSHYSLVDHENSNHTNECSQQSVAETSKSVIGDTKWNSLQNSVEEKEEYFSTSRAFDLGLTGGNSGENFLYNREKTPSLDLDEDSLSAIDQEKAIGVKKQFTCPECKKNYEKKKTLIKHLVTHEKAESKYKCPVCDRYLVSTSELNRHVRAHRGLKPYECSICKQYFSQKNLLDNHMNWHEGRKSHLCDICGQSLSNKSNLRMHVSLLHSSDEKKKTFECSFCGKSFSRKNHLQTHYIVHDNSRTHQCSTCGKTFKRFSQLKEHEYLHTGEKKYKCDECDKDFATMRVLKIHKLLHSGLKNFKCTKCEKSFIRRNNLMAHLKVHAQNADGKSMVDERLRKTDVK